MMTDVWGLKETEAVGGKFPEVTVTADRIDDQSGSESYYALQNYQMNESRLFWLGYGAINQVIQPSPENSQNKILAATQAKSKNIGAPPASQVPNVRGKIRGNTTIGTPKASANTVTIDDNFVKRENQMIENKKSFYVQNTVYRPDIFQISINGCDIDKLGFGGSLDFNFDKDGDWLANTFTPKAGLGKDFSLGISCSGIWYSCPEEYVNADLLATNSLKNDPDFPGISLSKNIYGPWSLNLGFGKNNDGIWYFSWGLGFGYSVGNASIGATNTTIIKKREE